MGDQKETELQFVLNVEGELGVSGPLLITETLWLFQMYEIEDVHFNHDSAVLLPMAYRDNQPLSKRNALEDIACCYLYAMQWPSKQVLIVGHTDKSGPPLYNDWLSEKRAKNVLNILLGRRPEWVKSVCSEKGGAAREGTPAYATRKREKGTPTAEEGKSKVEDYQMILKWVAGKFGWSSCDPGPVRDDGPARAGRTKKAIEAFQASYNSEEYMGKKSVREIVGRGSIAKNGFMNRETWGAFWDIYMLELAELLGLYKVVNKNQIPDTSRLQTYRNALKFVDPNQIVCGGESHARSPRSRSRSDRRVHILFFDPKEKPKLGHLPFCHKPRSSPRTLGQRARKADRRRANKCELYGKRGVYGWSFLAPCDLDHILYVEVLFCNPSRERVTVMVHDERYLPPRLLADAAYAGRINANGVFIVPEIEEGNYIVSVDTTNLQNPERFEGVEERVEIKPSKK